MDVVIAFMALVHHIPVFINSYGNDNKVHPSFMMPKFKVNLESGQIWFIKYSIGMNT